MKNQVGIFLGIIAIMLIINGCHKGDNSIDYLASVKNRTWWGTLTYTGKESEPYSVHFNEDKSLVWSQMVGDFTGSWNLNGKKLSISFDGNSVVITGDISNNNKLINIADNTSNSEINSGELIIQPNLQLLSNTIWKGEITSTTDEPIPLQMRFMAGDSVEVKFTNTVYRPFPYTRSESGVVFRANIEATFLFFGVIISDTEMKGIQNIPDYQWHTVKQ